MGDAIIELGWTTAEDFGKQDDAVDRIRADLGGFRLLRGDENVDRRQHQRSDSGEPE